MQVNEEHYNACLENIMAIPAEAVTYDHAPPSASTAEASRLTSVAAGDRDQLLASGIAVYFLDQLPIRAAAYLYAVARYVLFADVDPEVLRQWKELAPRGFEVVRYLKRFLSFAYRGDPDLSAAVSRIRGGNGYKDLLLDLLSLHLLATEHPEPLEGMAMFDKSTVQEASTLHEALGDLYARMTTEPDETAAAKDIMHRAYTYYKQVADAVIAHGRFVFEGTPRYAAYVSAYRSQTSRQAAQAENEDSTADVPSLESVPSIAEDSAA